MVINSSTAAVCVCGNPPLQIVSAVAKLPQLLQKPFSAATWEQERGTEENLVFSAIIFFLLLCGRLQKFGAENEAVDCCFAGMHSSVYD